MITGGGSYRGLVMGYVRELCNSYSVGHGQEQGLRRY